MSSRKIIDAIQHISGVKQADAVTYIPCTVTSVDEPSRTCTCMPQGGNIQAPMSDVLLMACVNDGILYIPSAGSTVLVTTSKFTQPYVAMFSSLDKILYIVGNSTIKVVDGTIQFNDGSFGGLAKIAVLTQKLNNLESLINNILNVLKSTVIPLAPTGTYPFSPLYASLNDILPITQQGDIENTAVKHGV